jgi:protease IV
MDKNRKIVLSILALVVLSVVLAVVDISLNLQGEKKDSFTLDSPGIGPGIGVIRISGELSFDAQSSALGAIEGAEVIIDSLDSMQSDSRIKAVVLRINSPGGTVAATQEIYSKIMKMRSKNIIFVASMGELAASGGYYIASACNQIFANDGTITGSIGVIAMSPNLKGLFDRLGIRMNVIKSGKYKDILAAYREISPEERDLVQQIIDSSYRKFLKDVSLGRNIPISDIEPYADGRIMSGEMAQKCKLIDALGTMEDALTKARELAKLPEDCPIYEDSGSPLERLFMRMQMMLGGNRTLGERVLNNFPMVEYRYQP